MGLWNSTGSPNVPDAVGDTGGTGIPEIDAFVPTFVNDLKKAINAEENERMQHDCNFGSTEELLKFIVRHSNTIIERRKVDLNCLQTHSHSVDNPESGRKK